VQGSWAKRPQRSLRCSGEVTWQCTLHDPPLLKSLLRPMAAAVYYFFSANMAFCYGIQNLEAVVKLS